VGALIRIIQDWTFVGAPFRKLKVRVDQAIFEFKGAPFGPDASERLSERQLFQVSDENVSEIGEVFGTVEFEEVPERPAALVANGADGGQPAVENSPALEFLVPIKAGDLDNDSGLDPADKAA
jgi:hypothetical protein